MRDGIRPEVLEQMKTLGDELITVHSDKIMGAYDAADDQKLNVSLSFTLAIGKKPGDYEATATIAYVVEKVKETIKATISATADLFPVEESKPYILNKTKKKEEGE